MSYYILPKNNNINININPSIQTKKLIPYTSFSLYYFYNKLFDENILLFENNFNDILKIINPYEFIFSKIPGTKISISKIPLHSRIFYDFLEVICTLNVFESFKNKSINSLHITTNYVSTIDSMEILRDNNTDIYFSKIKSTLKDEIHESVDFIFYELEESNNESINVYILDFLNILKIILKSQKENGSCVIKISTMFYKPIIDIVYILTTLYDKVYVIKPNTSNIISYEKYIVCKNFILNEKVSIIYNNYYEKIVNFYNGINNEEIINGFINCITDYNLPRYFINKIDDINIITGQQQLEYVNQLVNTLKNKNYEIKLENIKKINIQKCIYWCEKYNIPCNKFIEKSNIFLQNTEENEIKEEL